MKLTRSESAVSPIIGTILLVAITVVFAAIITAVLLGLSGDPDAKDIGINAKPAAVGANATIILYGGASLSDLVKLEMIDQGSSNGTYIEFWNSSVTDQVIVGYPYPVKEVAQSSETVSVYETMINVKGTFSDGKEVILLVQPMTFYNVGPPPITLSNYFESITLRIVYNNGASARDIDLLSLPAGSTIEIPAADFLYDMNDATEMVNLTLTAVSVLNEPDTYPNGIRPGAIFRGMNSWVGSNYWDVYGGTSIFEYNYGLRGRDISVQVLVYERQSVNQLYNAIWYIKVIR